MTHTPAVCFLPDNTKLGFTPSQLELDRFDWPLGQPDRLKGRKLRDLASSDHLVVPPKSTTCFRPSFGTRAKVSIMFLEPRAIHEQHVSRLRRFHWRFHRIYTAIEGDLIEQIPNGVLFPFGSTWVTDHDRVGITKTRNLSIIASAKRSQTGHVLRHDMIDWAHQNGIEMDAMGGGYVPFELKKDGLAPYRFSLVIENAQEPNYFTEKLVDAILCETVPIYWGCPNIERFIDPACMIRCNTFEELQEATRNATPALYDQMRPALLAAHDRAHFFGQHKLRLARHLLADTPVF